ncbi:MAG TPA: hypothetical protein VKX46_20400 [Ktedonobacteraceae bacterium]|nr:hypothetical protein [Ktedonobacteraceae bacterium]
MTTTNRPTIVGVFTNRDQANQAIDELHQLGFTDNNIGYAVRDGEMTDSTIGSAEAQHTGRNAAAGAIGGGVVGGLIGAAASLLIPGFGPVVAGGILVATLGGAAIGAAAGGLIGALTEMGVPEEEAQYYQGEFEAGRVIVTVDTTGVGRQQEALDVLRRNGAYDANTRGTITDTQAGTYTSTGSETYAQSGMATAPTSYARSDVANTNNAGTYTQPDSYANGDTNRNYVQSDTSTEDEYARRGVPAPNPQYNEMRSRERMDPTMQNDYDPNAPQS